MPSLGKCLDSGPIIVKHEVLAALGRWQLVEIR